MILGPNDFKRCLDELQPMIGRYGWMLALIRLRVRQKGYFPSRTFRTLKKFARDRRPYFIGQTRDGIRYVGDIRDEYSVALSVFPDYDGNNARFIRDRAAACGGLFVDVGTNMGIVAAMAAKAMADQGGEVLGLEPMPSTAKRAAATFALNGLTNVRLVQAAAGDADGELELHMVEGHSEMASAHATTLISGNVRSTFVLPSKTLDTLSAELALPRVAFLKIDVEGHEPQVVRGARSLLARDHPTVLFEYHPGIAPGCGWGLKDMEPLLTDSGPCRFTVFHGDGTLSKYPHPSESCEMVNILCEPGEAPELDERSNLQLVGQAVAG